MFDKKTSLLFFGLAILCGFFVSSQSAAAATITVDDTSSTGTPATCTLSSAIRAANTNTTIDGCTAGEAPTAAVDVIQLGVGTYGLDLAFANTLTEASTISGVDKVTSLVDLTGVTQPLADIGVSATTQVVTIANVGFTAGAIQMNRSGSGTVNFDIHDANFLGATLSFVLTDGSGDIDVNNVSLMGLWITQAGTANYASLVHNTEIADNGAAIVNDSSNAGDTMFDQTEFTGSGGATSVGLSHDKSTASSAKVTLKNSSVQGYNKGVLNNECAIPYATQDGSTMYVENSSIGGAGTQIGLQNTCGHAVITSTTFSDISGSAVVLYTNTPLSDYLDTATRGSSLVESYNSTYYNIRPDSSEAVLLSYGPSGSVQDKVFLNGVVVVYTTTDVGVATTTGSRLQFDHNTFAGNVLGAYSDIVFVNAASMQDVVLRNNAFEGLALVGIFSTSGSRTISNNLTTGASQTGIAHVADFFLGAFQDNGGIAPLGVSGRLGNVRTLRPLAASPLIDGGPYVNLDTDQRNVHRSLLGAYDVGSVEVTLTEFTSDGGIWPRPTTSLVNTGTRTVTFALGAVGLIATATHVFTRSRRLYVHHAFRR